MTGEEVAGFNTTVLPEKACSCEAHRDSRREIPGRNDDPHPQRQMQQLDLPVGSADCGLRGP